MTVATRLARVGLACLIVAGATGTAWLMVPEAFPRLGPRSGAEGPAVPALLVAAGVPAVAPTAAIAGPSPRVAEAPRFQIARIGARGMLVTAGNAAPGAEVQLLEGGREIGRTRADARGEWVILPGDPLRPGARELSLLARSPGGVALAAQDTLLLMVPEPQLALAGADPGRRAEAAGGMTMLLPPTTAAGSPRLLQTPREAAPGRQRLGLDMVDYDEAGGMRFAGSAAPGSTVRVYVGSGHAGDALADPAGRWSLRPSPQPAHGRHTLRLDQVAAAGTVAERIELPFQRDRVPPEMLADGRLVVQPGANLWRLARRLYGQGTRYTVLYQANRELIRDPNLIYPGQLFSLPEDLPETISSRSR